MNKLETLFAAVAVLSISFLNSGSAAYLDPNIGSMLLQGAVAGIAVVTVTVKMYWYRIKAFFTGEKLDLDEDLLADLDAPAEEKTEE